MAVKVTQALIYAELMNIKRTIAAHTEQDNANFQELKSYIEGTPSTPGIKIRVDRIEQAEVVKKRHFGYVWAAIIVLLSAAVTQLWP